MELIFKSPIHKPRFMGVLFEDERTARRTMIDIIHNHRSELFNMKLDLLGGCATVRVFSDSSNAFFMYPSPVKCSMSDLQRWNGAINGNFTFGHIIKKFDNHILVKSLEKEVNFYIHIKNLYIEYG